MDMFHSGLTLVTLRSQYALDNKLSQSGLKCVTEMPNSECYSVELGGLFFFKEGVCFDFNLTWRMAETNRSVQNKLSNKFLSCGGY